MGTRLKILTHIETHGSLNDTTNRTIYASNGTVDVVSVHDIAPYHCHLCAQGLQILNKATGRGFVGTTATHKDEFTGAS
jgi:hypothetical protein